MKITSKTWALLAVLGVLLALNLIDRGSGHRLAEQLPELSALDRKTATRIEISRVTEKMIVEKQGEGEEARWRITAPIQADADQILVRTLLTAFRKTVPIDIKVDEGELEPYGLDPGTGIIVEIWEGAGKPSVSFTVGNDAPGGSTFIRISGDESIYRARVGSRRLYDRNPTDWRNKVLLDFSDEVVSGVGIRLGDGSGTVLRREPGSELDKEGNAALGEWALEPAVPWRVDQLAVQAMVRGLGQMRAGAVLDPSFEGGFQSPAGTIEVVLTDGTRKELVVGSRKVEGGAFVKVTGQPEVFRVADPTVDRALVHTEDLRDKTLFDIDRGQIDTLALEDRQSNILLQQDLSNGMWRVLQPANMDVDVKLVLFAVNTLRELRADEVVETTPGAAGLTEPKARIIAHTLSGQDLVLEIGLETRDEAGRPCSFVRRAGESQVYLLRQTTVEKLKQGFGRI